MNHLIETTKRVEEKFAGRVITVQVETVELPNGQTATREIVKHPGAVCVIAFHEGKLLMVRQFRKALGKVIVEIPAGKLEAGEEPAVCAKRELEEETGFTCQSVRKLTSFYVSPGFCDEIVHVYVAEQLTRIDGQHLDEDEFVDVLHVSLQEALAMVEAEQIHDAKTAYAVQYWQLTQ